MSLRVALARSSIAWLLLVPFARAEEKYAIQFERPVKVGARYHVFCQGAIEQVAESVANGRRLPQSGESMEVDLHADVEVLAVTPKGKEKKVRLTNTRAKVEANAGPVKVLADGAVVVIEQDGKKTKYTVDGRPASAQAAKALGLALSLSSDEQSDDLVFGTPERRAVGERWEANSAAAAASLAVMLGGGTFRVQDIQGGCSLDSVTAYEGVRALRLGGNLRIANLHVPLPNNLKMREGRVEAAFSAYLPVDLTKGPLRRTSHTVTEILAAGDKDGVKIEVQTKSKETRDVRVTDR